MRLKRLREPLLARRIADEAVGASIVPVAAGLLAPPPARFQVLALGAADDDAAPPAFAGPEQADFGVEAVADGTGLALGLVEQGRFLAV
mgnify:CR=1 FL=1